MLVKVVDYGKKKSDYENLEDLNYVKYKVSGLDEDSQNKLIDNLDEETEIVSGYLMVTVYYKKEYFPFGSNDAAIKPEDFIARDEIEMTIFLSAVLEE
ncbi:MAG: hypothetical protein CVV28_00110 [Methanobacteriales archaeon HGW-Methanobacteriales-1]|jgi:hypothetical protein|nr:MAG: hypothetical protein CVV28_00110 [Methanobacteriales archaeon HGW-Methanobacteriales-1]